MATPVPGCVYRGRYMTIWQLHAETRISRQSLYRWYHEDMLSEAVIEAFFAEQAERDRVRALAEKARANGLRPHIPRVRMRLWGWDEERAYTTPARKQRVSAAQAASEERS